MTDKNKKRFNIFYISIYFILLLFPLYIIGLIQVNKNEYVEKNYEFTIVGSEHFDAGYKQPHKQYLIIKDNEGRVRDINVTVSTYNQNKNKLGSKIYFKMYKWEYDQNQPISGFGAFIFILSIIAMIVLLIMCGCMFDNNIVTVPNMHYSLILTTIYAFTLIFFIASIFGTIIR